MRFPCRLFSTLGEGFPVQSHKPGTQGVQGCSLHLWCFSSVYSLSFTLLCSCGQRLKYGLHTCVFLPKLETAALYTLLYVNSVSIKLMSEHNQNRAKHKAAQHQRMMGCTTTWNLALEAEKTALWVKLLTAKTWGLSSNPQHHVRAGHKYADATTQVPGK